MGKERMRFDFERLDVVAILDELAEELPDGRGYIQDQLRRAANSIALNIAEGAGEFAPAENVGDVGPSMRRARAGQDRRAERGVICW